MKHKRTGNKINKIKVIYLHNEQETYNKEGQPKATD